MAKKSVLVDSRAVLDALGIRTKSTLSRFIKKGMPVAKRVPHAGHHRNLFNLDDVRKWYVENVRADSARLTHVASSGTNGKGTNAVASGDDHSPPDDPEQNSMWSHALERCRNAEKFAYNRWVHSVNSGEAAGAAAMYRIWEKAIETLRRVEKDSAAIEKQRGEVISLKDAERIYMLSHGAVEGELRHFAKRLGSTLATKRSKKECIRIINEEVDRTLRHLVDALKKLKEAG